MKKIFLILTLAIGLFSCKNFDIDHPDFNYTSGFFPYQFPVRTLVLGDYIVVGDNEGYLYWISQTTGKIAAMQEVDSAGLYATPIIDGDLIYIQTRGGELVAIKRPS